VKEKPNISGFFPRHIQVRRKSFYEYVKTLEAMKASLKGEKTLILPIDSPITKYFRNIDKLELF